MTSQYESWTRDELIARLAQLERPNRHDPPPAKAPTREKVFNFASYSRRKIALKFCYSGWEYGGLAFQLGKTPLPTVENVLFDALSKAHLIDPEAGAEGCGWEKCGRTDRGVSAAGQVISLWVRSALISSDIASRPSAPLVFSTPSGESLPMEDSPSHDTSALFNSSDYDVSSIDDEFGSFGLSDTEDTPTLNTSLPQTNSKPEHDYLGILNRILPPTIRIIAWSPIAPEFSARFNCTHRHYKYFFSSSGLDVPRMRDAASRLVGLHDFRNLCKLDPGKQITEFKRRIIRAEIKPLDDGVQGTYVFNLLGSAFLYHQVRHIMAVLFLVGTGLEHPSIVSSLMNIEDGMETRLDGDPELAIVTRKPIYQMADALPLMLWECGYPEGQLEWRTDSRDQLVAGVVDASDLYHQLHSIHSRSQIFTALGQHFLAAASQHHVAPVSVFPLTQPGATSLDARIMLNLPLGGGMYTRTGKYVKLAERERLDDVAVANERWRAGKGTRREERKKLANDDKDGDE